MSISETNSLCLSDDIQLTNYFIEETKEDIEETNEIKISDYVKEFVLKNLFVNIVEHYIVNGDNNLKKFNINLTSDEKLCLLLLCKEAPEMFLEIENTLKEIIEDNKIDTKDLPKILLLVSKVYNNVKVTQNRYMIEPYVIIKLLLSISLIAYLNSNVNNKLLIDLINVIESSINLLKLTPITTSIVKKKFICNLFKCK